MTVTVQWDVGGPHVLISKGTRLPERFVATYDAPGLPIVRATLAMVAGVPVCDRLEVERRDQGASLTGAELRRVPLVEVVEIACRHAALTHVETFPDGSTAWEPAWDDSDREKQVRRDVAKARGRRRLTDALLQDVARIYRAEPDAPTVAVREAFGISPAQASRYVREARNRGFLQERGR